MLCGAAAICSASRMRFSLGTISSDFLRFSRVDPKARVHAERQYFTEGETIMEKLTVYRENGYEIGVKLSGNLEKYALDFLHIFNNVKERDGLIRVWNDYGSTVYVVCDEDTHEACREYLEQFGEIKSDRPVQLMRVDGIANNISYDFDKYDDIILDPVID